MKKKIALLLAAMCAIAALGLSGCAKEEEPVEEEPQVTEVNITTGGSYYEYMAAIVEAVKEQLTDIEFNVKSTGSAVGNVSLVNEGDDQIGLTQTDIIDYAYNGYVFFKNNALKNFSVIGACYSEVCQIAVCAESQISSPADLKGKTIAIGEKNSMTEYNARSILKAYGMSLEDVNAQSLNYKDSIEAMKNGEIDAMFFTSGVPTVDVMELAVTNGVKVLEISGEEADALMESHSYFVPYVIPKGTYSGQEEDITTLSVKTVIIVNNDLDEDTVYKITKSLFENKDTIAENEARAGELDEAFAVEGLSVPLHPGAEKYYKEIGVL